MSRPSHPHSEAAFTTTDAATKTRDIDFLGRRYTKPGRVGPHTRTQHSHPEPTTLSTSHDSGEMNGHGTQDRQNPGGEGSDEKLLSLLPRFVLTDLRKSDHTLGGNNRGDSSGRLNGGE